MSTGGARAGEGAPGSRVTGATAAVFFGSEEVGTGTGAEAGGGTDAAMSTGGARAGEGAPGSRATGATAAVSFGSEEAGTGGTGAAGGGTDCCREQRRGKSGRRRTSTRVQSARPPQFPSAPRKPVLVPEPWQAAGRMVQCADQELKPRADQEWAQ